MRDGTLAGASAREAFFVRCDRTTMTRAEIDDGNLVVLVGLAQVRPAEFATLRFRYSAAAAAPPEPEA